MNHFITFAVISALMLLVAYRWRERYPATSAPASRPQRWNTTVSMLMVRDEAAIIERAVTSLVTHVGRRVFLCDTGCSDDTVDKALSAVAAVAGADLVHWQLPGGFKHFEQARNACRRALAAANLPDVEWVALPDADFEAEPAAAAPGTADEWPAYDVLTIQIRPTHPGMPHNSLHLLVRAPIYFERCRYRLWTHEFLDCKGDPDTTYGYFNGFHFLDHADGSSRPAKLTRDIQLLRDWLARVNETELRPRALYYLARAYEDGGQLGLALKTYARHNAEQTHTNYQFYAAYRMALIELQTWSARCNGNASECANLRSVEEAMLRAWRTYDGYFRREPLYQLALLHRRLGHYHECLLYAGAGLQLPPVDHSRIPLMIEPAMHGTLLQQEHDYCASQLKAPVIPCPRRRYLPWFCVSA